MALEQVDKRKLYTLHEPSHKALIPLPTVKYFLISAPVDWSADQYIRRFALPNGEYVSCVIW